MVCIFMYYLCCVWCYCYDLGECVGVLYVQVEWLVQQVGCQFDFFIVFYYFNVFFYLFWVLKGNIVEGCVYEIQEKQKVGIDFSYMFMGLQVVSCLDLNLVIWVYLIVLSFFLIKCNSFFIVFMFFSFFFWYLVFCQSLFFILVQYIMGLVWFCYQVCLLFQKILFMWEVRLCFEDFEWKQLMGQVLVKVIENLCVLGEVQIKVQYQQVLFFLELFNVFFRICKYEKLILDLMVFLGVLQG